MRERAEHGTDQTAKFGWREDSDRLEKERVFEVSTNAMLTFGSISLIIRKSRRFIPVRSLIAHPSQILQ
jgi:hypothetical protein